MTDQVTLNSIAKMIDHSLLHPTMTDDDIEKGCALAKKFNVATACIKPYCIPMVRELLAGSGVGVFSAISSVLISDISLHFYIFLNKCHHG